MSTWEEGRTYDYFGQPIVCVRRFFVGRMEHVIVWSAPGVRVVSDGGYFGHLARTQAIACALDDVRPPPLDEHCERWLRGDFADDPRSPGLHSPSGFWCRTARTLDCVKPRITDTLGGVTRYDACHHDWYRSIIANAGPFAGRRCCTACGDALEDVTP